MHRNEWTMFYGVKRIKSNVNKYKLKYISILSVADATYSTNLSWAVNLISTFLSIQIQSINLKLNMKGINNVQRYTSNANIKNKRMQETSQFWRNMSLWSCWKSVFYTSTFTSYYLREKTSFPIFHLSVVSLNVRS
jgi:hypothetical protein